MAQPIFRHFTKQEGAPESTTVLKIIQDRQGVMWFATSSGLFSFDSRFFKKYENRNDNPQSISVSQAQDVISDSHGDLWIGTSNGLIRYNKILGSVEKFRHDPQNKNSLSGDFIFSLMEDARGGIWAGTTKGLNYLTFEGTLPKITRFPLTDDKDDPVVVRSMAEGADGTLWMGTSVGLISMRKDGSHRMIFKKSELDEEKVQNYVISIHLDKRNRVWVGFKTGGLYLLDNQSPKIRLIEQFKKNKGKIYPEIRQMISAGEDGLWIASTSGLASFNTVTQQSQWYNNEYGNANSLSNDAVYALCKDRQGGIWVGAYNSTIDYLDVQTGQFKPVPLLDKTSNNRPFDLAWIGRHETLGLWAISEDRSRIVFLKPGTSKQSEFHIPVISPGTYRYFYVDKSGILWGAGTSVLSRYNLSTGEAKDYALRLTGEVKPITGNITLIYEDNRGVLWVGGSYGMLLFDRESGLFRQVQKRDGTPLPLDLSSVNAILKDSKGNVWMGGKNVFIQRPGSQGFEQIEMDPASDSTKQVSVHYIREDPQGRIWFAAAAGGLQVYDSKLHRVTRIFRGKRTLVDEAATILIDKNGNIWIDTQNGGLTRYHPDRRSLQTYDRMDGLPADQLKMETRFQDSNGTMYFGTSTKGAFSFNPSDIRTNTVAQPIVFSSLKLFSKPVEAGDTTGILRQPLNSAREIVFRYDQNIFTLDFATLNYIRSDKNQYAYMLEGFEKKWNYVGVPSATYTNLSPGSYTFLVKAANNDGYWSKQPARLTITVLPPWWGTWYAYLAYLLIFAAASYAVMKFFWARSLFRKESELYQAKLDFFTNVSHEIRTHLTLIAGPIQKVFQSRSIETDDRNLLSYAKKNSDRLMSLVSELLEFRKMESGDVMLQVSEENLVDNLKIAHAAFEHFLKEKQITTSLAFPRPEILVWYDASQMQKVFYNLLSNACKFTPKGGTVRITVEENDKYLWVNVIDNGRGISDEHLERIFENFFQDYNQDTPNRGYGIGLALSKKIVERQKGFLTVSSRNTVGEQRETCFSIRILKGNSHFDASELSASHLPIKKADLPEHYENLPLASRPQSPRKHTVLLIEDNAELRAFTREILENTYKVLEAAEGLAGIEAAREHMPDLIVSDIMMPEMNGLDLCTQLKSDIRTSHIPIILLTARGATHHVVQGLKAGADAYIVKPFDIRVLELKIKNLIHIRQVLQHSNNPFVTVQPDGEVLAELDRQFLAKLRAIVEENITDPDFGGKQMADEMGMSLSVLYRKMRAIQGMTVNDFVKSIRMQKAAQLLSTKAYHVNEVALMVGFENRKYFSREFQKIYGKLPSKFEVALLNEND